MIQIQEKLEKNEYFINLMNKIDVDKDKTISFEEYLILTTITSINRTDLIRFYNKEIITIGELAKFIVDKIISNSQLKITNSKLDSRTVKTSEKKINEVALNFIKAEFQNLQTVNIKTDFLKYKLNLIMGLFFYEVIHKIYYS